MASSFTGQVPSIIHLVANLRPARVLDIGKGFGKYGFLIHEYVGIDNKKKIDPALTLAQQSNILIDAVEIDADLMLPHLSNFYSTVFFGDVLNLYKTLPSYDLVLMIDIIEHIDKEPAIEMLKYWLKQGSQVIIATPLDFFQQHLYESVFEDHVSHWRLKDFKSLGHVDFQYLDGGAVYLLTNNKVKVRGFGASFMHKIRRVARAIRNEI